MRFREELERRKRASMGQLLLRSARLFNERAIGRLQRTRPEARVAHTQLYPHIDLEGTRLVELARRVGTSKQAVGQLVGELEALGVVRREPDPADARAKRVCFTARGRRALLEGLGVLRDTEAELARVIGRSRLRRLRADLAALLAALEPAPGAALGAPGGERGAARGRAQARSPAISSTHTHSSKSQRARASRPAGIDSRGT